MNDHTFLVDFKKDVLFYSKLISAKNEEEAAIKATSYIKPNYKIDEILDLGESSK